MEKWSAIHNTFKFFKLGPPPRLEKINKSKKLQERIYLLNRVKNICLKNDSTRLNLVGIRKGMLNEKLKEVLEIKNIQPLNPPLP